MIKQDFYTGTSIEESSNLIDVRDVDQKNMMNQFYTDPNQRLNQLDQQISNPFIPINRQVQPIQPPMYGGYVGNPMFQTGYNSFGYYQNPAFNGYNGYYQGQFNGWYQPPVQQPQDQTVHVPGLSFSNSGLMLTADAQEVCEQLQLDMMVEQEEAIVKRNQRFQGYFNNNGYNYYGMPFYNSYQDTAVTRKYIDKINELKQEAMDRRKNFNKNLLKMAYNYLGTEVDDNDIDLICGGYDYVIPSNTIQTQMDMNRFSRMVPVTNQPAYAREYQEDVKLHEYLNQTNDMNGFLGSLGVIKVCNELEQEMHHRRDGSQLYSSDSYKKYLRKHIMQRDGMAPENGYLNAAQIIDSTIYPTLGSAGKMLEDGTISITAPPWLGGSDSLKRIQVNDEMEKHFEENRQAFLQSIYAQEGNR